MANKRHEMDMCSGPLFGKMIRFAIPVVITSVLQMVYNAADMAVVGRFGGSTSLASVGSTTYLINLLVGLFSGVATGSSVLVAQRYGAKDAQGVKTVVHTSIALSLLFGFVLMLIGLLFSEQMLIWMDTPADVLTGAALYLKIYFLGIPAMMVFNFAAAILRAVGDTRRPMYYQILSGALNVLLNLLFVIAFKWDVAGVGASTTLSQYLCCGLVLRCMLRSRDSVRLEPRQLRMEKKSTLSILRIGLPNGINAGLFSISNVLIQSGINSFGAATIAANSAALSIEGFIDLAASALFNVNLSFVGQNMGAKKYDRIDRICKISVLLSLLCWIVLGGALYLLREPLLGIYTTDAEVIRIGSMRMSIMLSGYFINMLMNAFVGTLRGMGYSILPTIESIFGICVFRLWWLWVVFERFHSLQVLYWSFPISWTLVAALRIGTYLVLRRRVFVPQGDENRQPAAQA